MVLMRNQTTYTHLHWDHVYYTPMFKNAKLYAQRKEYEFALNPIPLYYKSYADQYGMEYADFLEQQVGMTEEEFVKKMTETVKQSLGQEMVLRAIAETEGIEISDEKFQEKASKYAAQMGSTDVDAFISQYGKSTIMASILQDEAVEILEKNAVVKNADGTLAETTAETETETASK